jgi:hypothetical protein
MLVFDAVYWQFTRFDGRLLSIFWLDHEPCIFLKTPMVLEYTLERLGGDREVVSRWEQPIKLRTSGGPQLSSSLDINYWWVNTSEPPPTATRKQTLECGSPPIKFPSPSVGHVDWHPRFGVSLCVSHQPQQDQPSYPPPPDCQAVHIAVRRKMRSSISGLVAIMDVKDSEVRTLPTWNVWNVPQHSLGSCGVGKCPIRITKTTLQRFAKPYSLWPVGSAACWWRTTATSCPGDDVRRSVECGAALASPNGFLSKWESYYPPKHRLAW